MVLHRFNYWPFGQVIRNCRQAACGHAEIETIIRSSFDELGAKFGSNHGGYVPVGTAFHERTLALCESLNYREWSGYYTVGAYEMTHEHEYNAIRNSAALIDISPLFKYRVTGGDATKIVNRVSTRGSNKGAVDQVSYCCWCGSAGKVVDDRAITRLGG